MKTLIEIAKKCTHVQEAWKPAVGDKCTYRHHGHVQRLNEDSALIKLVGDSWLEDKSKYIFLPNTDWCMEQIRSKFVEMNYWDEFGWRIRILRTEKVNGGNFVHPNLNIASLLAAEFVLSNDKNDLREMVKELEANNAGS